MAVTLSDFLLPVVLNASRLLQIQEADTDEIAENDPIVQLCASMAYSQITSYLNRKLISATYYEEYIDVESRFMLRVTPVASITSFTLDDELLDVGDEGYSIINNTITIGVGAPPDMSGVGTETLYSPIIVYEGGVVNLIDQPDFLNALILQTVAIYNRKDTLGVIRVQAEGGSEIHGTDTYNPDAGDILEAVVLILNPYVYYGSVRDM